MSAARRGVAHISIMQECCRIHKIGPECGRPLTTNPHLGLGESHDNEKGLDTATAVSVGIVPALGPSGGVHARAPRLAG